MKKFGVMMGAALALCAVPAFATTDSCAGTNTTSFSDPVANAVFSITCGDKMFSNFTTTGTSGTIVINELANSQYSLIFTATNGAAFTTSPFTFGFNVAVIAGSPYNITQLTTSMSTSVAAGGNPLPNASTGVVTYSVGTGFTLTADTQQHEGNSSNMSTTSDLITFKYDPDGAPANGAAGQFGQLTVQIGQTAIPEPMTFSLMGFGLLGLGLLKKRLS